MVKLIPIANIRIDGGTQPRAQINNDVVSDYGFAIRDGAEFPPVVVFHDGVDYWLADGFHRFFATKQTGEDEIRATVNGGTRRDAVLYSLSANATHGLRRTNEDKRKAVMTMLGDPEWSLMTDSKIANLCAVTHQYVSKLRAGSHATVACDKPEVSHATVACDKPEASHATVISDNPPPQPSPLAEKAKAIADAGGKPRIYTDKHGNQGVMDVSAINKTGPAKKQAEPAPAPEPEAPAGEADELRERLAEMSELLESANAELNQMSRIVEADDQLAAAMAEIKHQKEQIAAYKSRLDGIMDEKNMAVSTVRSRDRRIAKLEAALRAMGGNPDEL